MPIGASRNNVMMEYSSLGRRRVVACLRGLLGALALVLLGLAAAPAGASGLKVGVFTGDEGRGPGAPVLVPPKAPEPGAATRGAVARASHARVPDADKPPQSAHGKLLIRIGRSVASCSATVINTPNESTIVSAGHCVRSGYGRFGVWARRVVFVPAYDRGRRPFGSFLATRIWVPREYYRYQNPNFDVSVIRLRPNERGRVAQVVGARGWATDVSRNRRYTVYGYPAGQMKGEVPRSCSSRVFGIREQSRRLPGPAPSRIVCDMASGSSGGGWIYGRGYLNSVIGYANRGRPGILYGPYFGREIRKLIRRVG